MKACSSGLREPGAAACGQPGRNVRQAASQFRVSPSSVGKLLHRQLTNGSRAGTSGGKCTRLLAWMRPPAPSWPPALAARCHPGRATRVAGRAGQTGREPGRGGTELAAEKSVHAAERDTQRGRALRAAFAKAVQAEDFSSYRCSRNVVPWPASLVTSIRPPWASTSRLTRKRPTPVPVAASGWKRRNSWNSSRP